MPGQRLQALDRARLEAWQLALGVFADRKPTPIINPLNGRPYVVEVRPEAVIVDGIDADETPVTLVRAER